MLLDALLPQTCVACDRWTAADEAPTCPDCGSSIESTQAAPYCPRCARTCSPLAAIDKGCPACRSEQTWNTAAIARVGLYNEKALRRLLVTLKFTGDERAADYMGRLLAHSLSKQPWLNDVDLLVPVPMHPLRRAQRPCDHASALAEAVSHRLRIAVSRTAVRRWKYSPSQTRASSRTGRFLNVQGCFGPGRRPRIAGQTVCIIDNLLVTGATIHEVSKVLRRIGARRIYAAIVARASLPGDAQATPPQVQ